MSDSAALSRQGADRPWLAALIIVGATAAVAALGASVSGGEGDPWYDGLNKAPGNPPGFLFGVVWPTLYTLMAIGAFLVWRAAGGWRPARRAMTLYFAQLAVNLAWSYLFFAMHQTLAALIDIAALCVLLVLMIGAFNRHSRIAALIQIPYLLWILFATYLNAWIVFNN